MLMLMLMSWLSSLAHKSVFYAYAYACAYACVASEDRVLRCMSAILNLGGKCPRVGMERDRVSQVEKERFGYFGLRLQRLYSLKKQITVKFSRSGYGNSTRQVKN